MAYWVKNVSPLKLAIAPRPRGGDWLDDEASAMHREGIDILVSLLTQEEEAELGLIDESKACSRVGIEFQQFSIPDRQTPTDISAFRRFAAKLHQQALQGKSIAAHCRAGIGRSSLCVASVLALEGYSVQEAFRLISEARGLQVPDTPEQVEWVRRFARPDAHT